VILKSSEKLRSVAGSHWPHFEVVRIHPTSRCELFMFAARLGSTKVECGEQQNGWGDIPEQAGYCSLLIGK
jgi:hypothetical protein